MTNDDMMTLNLKRLNVQVMLNNLIDCATGGTVRKESNMTLEEKRIERLYKLLHQIERKDPDTAAALRWAIFELERNLK